MAQPKTPNGPDIIQVEVHKGQRRALLSDTRIVVVVAGTGGGKSTIGPAWLCREIQTYWNAPLDSQVYLVAAPTYRLLRVALGKMKPYLTRMGDTSVGEAKDGWQAGTNTWRLENGAEVRFASIDSPGGIEGVHYRAAWCDEWGQVDDTQHSTVQRRLAFFKGRWLITTTPYPERGSMQRTWLRQFIEDFKAGRDPEVEVVNFPSWWNPAYPMDEVERLRRTEPAWRFAMFMEGILTRPEGLVYDRFSEVDMVIDPIPLSSPIMHDDIEMGREAWIVNAGMDFGGTNPTAILWSCLSPDGILYIFGERYVGNKTLASHMVALGASVTDKDGEPVEFDGIGYGPQAADTVFADPSGKQSIIDLRDNDVFARPANNEVEGGIQAVYEMMATGRLYIFKGRCPNLLRELGSYRRADNGNPVKEEDHAVDALRYLVMGVKKITRAGNVKVTYG